MILLSLPTMAKHQWAFWDAETLPQLPPADELAVFERIWLLYEHKNPLPFCNEAQQQVLETRLRTLSGISELPLFLSFLLGEAHQEAPPEISFRVFSTNKQLKPLLKYLEHQGRGCQRRVPARRESSVEQDVVKVIQVLEKRPPDLRPKTLTALRNFLRNILPETSEPEEVWQALQAQDLMELQGNEQVVCINEQLGWPRFLLLDNLRNIPQSQRPAKYNRLVNHIGTFFTRRVNPHLLIEQLRNEKLLTVTRYNQVRYHF